MNSWFFELDVSTSFFFTPHEVAIIGKELAKIKPLLTLIFFSYVSYNYTNIKYLNNNININSKQKAPNLSIGKIMRIFGDSDKKMTKRIKKE